MSKSKQIKLIKNWQHYRKGFILTPPAMLREWLVKNGFAEYLTNEPVQEKLHTRKTLKLKKNAVN